MFDHDLVPLCDRLAQIHVREFAWLQKNWSYIAFESSAGIPDMPEMSLTASTSVLVSCCCWSERRLVTWWPGRKRQRQLLKILCLLSKMQGRWSVSRSSVYLMFLTHQVSLSASLTLEWAGTNRSKRTMARRKPGRGESTTSSVGTQWRRCWIRSCGCCSFATWSWQHCAVAQDNEGVFQQQGVRALQRYKGYNRSIHEIYDKMHHINMLMSLLINPRPKC